MWPFDKKQKLITMPEAHGFDLKSLTLPQSQPNWKLFATKAKDWDVEKAILEGYNESTIVYACVEKRAKLIASVPWIVKVKGKDDEGNDTWIKDDAHPLKKLLSRPNPDQSFYELMYSASQYLDLAGSSFISKVRAGLKDLPQELWCLPSQYIKIKPGNVRLVDYYEHSLITSGNRIQAKDMVHLRLPNPSSAYWGQPVLKAAAKPTDIDREGGIWQKVSLENRGAADINIKLAPDATQEHVTRIKDQYQKQQTGPKNARKALITNADIQQLGSNSLELDFVNSRRAVWTEICAAFGMSLANLGMTEAVNLANAEAMNKALWENTILPQLELIERQLTHQLAGDYGDDVRLEPDLSNVEALQDKLSDKLEAAAKAQALGVPFNEYNEKLELGFKSRDDGDVSYIPQGLIPASYDLGLDDGSNAEGDGVDAYGSTQPVEEDIQGAALNGAQVTSLQGIIQSVAEGMLPVDTARALIRSAFPAIPESDIDDMINGVDGFVQRVIG